MAMLTGRTSFRILAYISAGLGVIGIALPLLPTTPFVILAAFFASKGSPAFAHWLEQHPKFGPAIAEWRLRRAIPRKAKVLAFAMMGFSWSTLVWLGSPGFMLVISGVFLAGVACYMLTRPSY